ncbi:MAG: RDD family protein [Phycisphaerae bacterium]
MMLRRAWAIGVLAVLAASTRAEDRLLSAGNAGALWVVRSSTGAETYDVAIRPLGGRWLTVTGTVVGAPAAAAAGGDGLHLFYRNGDYRIYNLADAASGQGSDGLLGPHVDGNPLAACGYAPLTRPGAHGGNVIVLTLQNSAPPLHAPRTATAASSAASVPAMDITLGPTRTARAETEPARVATSPATRRATSAPGARTMYAPPQLVHVWQSAEGGWTLIGSLRAVLSPQTRISSAVLNGSIYVMVSEASGNRLLVLEDRAAREIHASAPATQMAATTRTKWHWKEVPLNGPAAGNRVVGMLALSDRVVLAMEGPPGQGDMATSPASRPPDRTLQIAAAGPGGEFTCQTVTEDGKVKLWDDANLPAVARLGDTVALIWRDGSSFESAFCDTAGRIIWAESAQPQARQAAGNQDLLQYFVVAALIAIFIPLIMVRPATPPRPFALPPGVAPASLGRRLAAGLIDFLPLYAVGGMIFPPPSMNPTDMYSFIREPKNVPDSFFYWMMTTLTLWVAYGIVMEYFYGATVGKMLLRLCVVGEDGKRPGLRGVLLRNLTKIIELATGIPIILVLVPMLTRYRQRLGDILARTCVVDATTLPAPGQGGQEDDDSRNSGPPN